jgi:D-3-phosphoglycerate dehydrogenase
MAGKSSGGAAAVQRMNTARIAVLSSAPVSIQSLERALEAYLPLMVCGTREQLAQALPSTDILVAQNKGFPFHILDAGLLRTASRLKLIQHHGVSHDATDARAAAALGIRVAVTSGQNHVSVAETAFHILMCLAKKVHETQRSLREGVMGRVLCTELAGKTLCIVGVGKIGQALAGMGSAFGMNVIGVRRRAQAGTSPRGFERVYTVDRLNEALGAADFTILAIPLNEETFDLVGEAQFRSMKPGALLVNISRGPNVNRDALVAALSAGRIAGFGADVYWTEPADPRDPLLQDSRVFVTPHIGAESAEAIDRMSLAVRQNIDRFVNGQALQNVVQP